MKIHNVTVSSMEAAKHVLESLQYRSDYEAACWSDECCVEVVGGGSKPESWWSVVISIVIPQPKGV
jgi:hypothetical protein